MDRFSILFTRFLAVLTVLVSLASPSFAFGELLGIGSRDQVTNLNRKLGGQILDFTNNHDGDHRLQSAALNEKRDLYVYLPPGYDGEKQFPGVLFLHGLGHDEKKFLDVVPMFDDAIRSGKLPPVIIVAPDGSVTGKPSLFNAGSFYINSKAGRFADHVMDEVWPFAKRTFTIRPERDAHVICGASMGGFGAFNLAFKNRQEFGHIVGLMPPLNLRYCDCDGRYLAAYDPNCVGLRTIERRNEVVGRFYGVVLIRSRRMMDPIVGRLNPDATAFIANENPFEMLTNYNIKPGEFNMFIGYGKKDEFNIDAEIEHFLDEAARKGISADVVVLPEGKHNIKTAIEMFPPLTVWLTDKLSKYTPPGYALSPVAATPPNTRGFGPLVRVRESLSPAKALRATLP